MFSVSMRIFCIEVSSMSTDGIFFSVAITTPFTALTPSDVAPAETAFSAYSICTSFPEGLKVVKENEYAFSPLRGPLGGGAFFSGASRHESAANVRGASRQAWAASAAAKAARSIFCQAVRAACHVHGDEECGSLAKV